MRKVELGAALRGIELQDGFLGQAAGQTCAVEFPFDLLPQQAEFGLRHLRLDAGGGQLELRLHEVEQQISRAEDVLVIVHVVAGTQARQNQGLFLQEQAIHIVLLVQKMGDFSFRNGGGLR